MTSPNLNPLQRLRGLNKSSTNFHDQISNILYGEEYKQWVQDINAGDVVRLVDYLDRVRHSAALSASCSSNRRLSTLSTPQVPVFGSVCENSGTYAAKE